jgi:Uma2 family endonuclease
MASTRHFTIEDLAALPDDGHVYELIDGVLMKRAPVGGRQGAIGSRVAGYVGSFVEEHGLGLVFSSSTIFVFGRNPDTGLRPDVSFLRSDRIPTGEAFERPPEVVPDFVAELVNPNDRADELEEKIAIYLQAGVPLLWVIWQHRRVVWVYATARPLHELSESDDLDGGEVLPGFRVAVADLFKVGR